ncbi:DNA polymerase I [Ereboglobus sp. PH5-5]|uniref:DNA polymerase domain-containing protein n=1 Tax=Ereboglobus sp. PH5-5 TaxID=2940529 RepID=UPI002406D8BD|nr:DNA polymerase domain-containing protein [Ereboglobus sp. PH5-5]MDF9833112.1 DNA polymerase I [Ereboglobus sp. PH5-5]
MSGQTPSAQHPAQSICGLWIDGDRVAHLSLANADGTRTGQSAAFHPFAWLTSAEIDSPEGARIEALKGRGVFTQLAHADTPDAYDALISAAKKTPADARVGTDVLRPFENQFLLQTRQRLFGDLGFHQLRRCQLDIETDSAGGGAFSDPSNPTDYVLAIGLQFTSADSPAPRRQLLVLDEPTAAAEKKLLEQFNAVLAAEDPDTIEGHNIFKFDLDYLRQRTRRHKIPCAWGRFGQKAAFRNSRLKVAERWLDFPRCDIPGRAVIDTYMLVQLHDITTREMTSYGLKDSAVFFGITAEDADATGARTYIKGSELRNAYRENREAFLAYLADDLRETKGLADLLLPTYFEQTRTFPILLQDAALRGTTTKIDLLFLEEYYHARQSCPAPVEMSAFAGGYTRSFKEGVFKNVLHFDVASLYPSLLLSIGQNPACDTLGVFIPMLARLREYRLKYKQLARTTDDELLRAEYQARQASFKILINSFYGYLGFSGARFGDGALAAEVTRRGRELLQALIDRLAAEGCDILEADTDGIYLSSKKYFADPSALLASAQTVLPEGIELEHDGSYAAMFCYKSKNYALIDKCPGGKITIRGSALRSRGIEPYLKKLSDTLIRYLLGATDESPLALLEDYRSRIGKSEMPVAELAKSEILSQNPETYERFIAEGGKPRRATAEVALRMTPRPRMGERVSYYITAREKGKTADWQRARPLGAHDAGLAPYDPVYYNDKLDDWLERYGAFLGDEAKRIAAEKPGAQGELF